MDDEFCPKLSWALICLSMLGLKSIHISKMGPCRMILLHAEMIWIMELHIIRDEITLYARVVASLMTGDLLTLHLCCIYRILSSIPVRQVFYICRIPFVQYI